MEKNNFAILLSIKPKFVRKILSGEKSYEFRKMLWKDCRALRLKELTIFMYCTSPVKRIVGSFQPVWIFEMEPYKIWDRCRIGAGIEYFDFLRYFNDCDKGFAIWIKNIKKFKDPVDPKELIENFHAPMNFMYIQDHQVIRKLEKIEVV